MQFDTASQNKNIIKFMAKNYNVFISHSWDHLDDLRSLRQHLQERGYFNVDFSEGDT